MAGDSPRAASVAASTRLTISVAPNPITALITRRIHRSRPRPGSPAGRWRETALTNSTNAASSSTADIGNRIRHCHKYTFASQRSETPSVHSAQVSQALRVDAPVADSDRE